MVKGLRTLEVITLFVEGLPAARTFYEEVFGLEVVYANEVSAVVKLDNLMINLLELRNAASVVEPATVAGPDAGTRMLLTIEVADVDATCAELQAHGVKLLNGPIDRSWGRRTAAFADPAGNVWEIAQLLEKG